MPLNPVMDFVSDWTVD